MRVTERYTSSRDVFRKRGERTSSDGIAFSPSRTKKKNPPWVSPCPLVFIYFGGGLYGVRCTVTPSGRCHSPRQQSVDMSLLFDTHLLSSSRM